MTITTRLDLILRSPSPPRRQHAAAADARGRASDDRHEAERARSVLALIPVLVAIALGSVVPAVASANEAIPLGTVQTLPLVIDHDYALQLVAVDAFHVRVAPMDKIRLGASATGPWVSDIYLPVGFAVATGVPGVGRHSALLYVLGASVGTNVRIDVWEYSDYHEQDLTTNPRMSALYDVPATSDHLTVVNPGGGRVSSTGAGGIDCGSTCAATYTFYDNGGFNAAKTVRLHPEPQPGYAFDNWSGPCTSRPGDDCIVDIVTAQDRKTIAVAWHRPQTLTVATQGNASGRVTSSPGGINCTSGTCTKDFGYGASVTLTAVPDPGSIFNGWTGCTANAAGNCVLLMDHTQSVTATFRQPRLTVSGTAQGRVTSTPAGINCSASGPCSTSYVSGTSVTLTAVPTTPGYYFVRWTGDCTGVSCTVTMNGDRAVAAVFRAPSVHLDVRNTSIPVAWRDDASVTVADAPPGAAMNVTVRGAGSVELSLNDRGPFGRSDLQFTINADRNGVASVPVFYLRGKQATHHPIDGTISASMTVTAPLSSAGPGSAAVHQQVIKVRNVVSVDDRRYSDPLQIVPPNPAALTVDPRVGFGFRVFPELSSVNDTTNPALRRRRVFRATLDQPDPSLDVVFVAFDVDDPSSDLRIDPNGVAGDDNLGSPAEFVSGTERDVVALRPTDATGVAEAVLEFGMQPGDNYRVVAFPAPADDTNYPLNMGNAEDFLVYGLDVYTNMGPLNATLVDLAANITPASAACASELYTVWRRLHIERDTMQPIPVGGNSASVQTVQSAVFDPARNETTLTITNATPNMDPGEYENGAITAAHGSGAPSTPARFRIATNSKTAFVVSGNARLALPAGSTVTVVDDDDMNEDDGNAPDGDEGEAFDPLDVSLLVGAGTNKFEPAYIVPTFDLVAQELADVPFQTNIDTKDDAIMEACLLPSAACGGPSIVNFGYRHRRGDPNFWVVNAVAAYQGPYGYDTDDDHEPALGGRAFPPEAVVLVFVEALRDVRAYWSSHGLLSGRETGHSATVRCTLAHELAHLLGATHEDGGLMLGMEGTKNCLTFSASSIRAMRSSVTAGGI